MKYVELIRVEQGTEATLGTLLVDGESICWTLEEPWRGNQQDISCIPPGRYPMKLEFSPSKGRALWTIKEVPGRKFVRIHAGNTVDDTEGCPLTGTDPDYFGGKRAVLKSKKALVKFMSYMGDDKEAVIDIRRA